MFHQDNLERICCWCEINRLSLNVPKCNVMSFTTTKKHPVHITRLLILLFKRSIKIKDLEVIFDTELA